MLYRFCLRIDARLKGLFVVFFCFIETNKIVYYTYYKLNKLNSDRGEVTIIIITRQLCEVLNEVLREKNEYTYV